MLITLCDRWVWSLAAIWLMFLLFWTVSIFCCSFLNTQPYNHMPLGRFFFISTVSRWVCYIASCNSLLKWLVHSFIHYLFRLAHCLRLMLKCESVFFVVLLWLIRTLLSFLHPINLHILTACCIFGVGEKYVNLAIKFTLFVYLILITRNGKSCCIDWIFFFALQRSPETK